MPTQALRPGHALQLLKGAQQYFPALIADIDQARREVRIETYIFDFTLGASDVAQALVRAAGRGVSVFVLVDGVGSAGIPPLWRDNFERSGVAFEVFSPVSRLGILSVRAWRRLHRKLCLIDGHVAYCGGINLLDDFHDPNHGALAEPRWDFCVRVTGPLVHDVHQALFQLWGRIKAVRQAREHAIGEAWHALRDSQFAWLEDEQALEMALRQETAEPARSGESAPLARAALLLRDNVTHRTNIERAYRKAIGEAKREIIIANAYFVPGARLRKALREAARRGVRVVLLLQGRYEYFMQFHAARSVYGMLLRHGVEIHEYAPSFLHAKVAVVDGHWATVGSSNLDPFSILLAREANLVIEDEAFAQQLRAEIMNAVQSGGVMVDPQIYARRPLRQRMLDMLAYGLMRLMLLLARRNY